MYTFFRAKKQHLNRFLLRCCDCFFSLPHPTVPAYMPFLFSSHGARKSDTRLSSLLSVHFPSRASLSFSISAVWYMPNFLFIRRIDFISLPSARIPAAASIFSIPACSLCFASTLWYMTSLCFVVFIFPHNPCYLITVWQVTEKRIPVTVILVRCHKRIAVVNAFAPL